jgi:hypothetical protein
MSFVLINFVCLVVCLDVCIVVGMSLFDVVSHRVDMSFVSVWS